LVAATGCGDDALSSASDSDGATTSATTDASTTNPGATTTTTGATTSAGSESASDGTTTTTTGDTSTTDGVTSSGTTDGETTTTTGDTTTTTTGDTTTTTGDTTTNTTGDTTTTGDDTTTTGDPPPDLGPYDVVDLDAGHGHVCAVLYSGKVKCWGGYNNSGDLGLGDTKAYGTMPGTMGNDLPFVDLGAGGLASAISSYYQGCAIVEGDKLKCWGQGTYGALGSGSSQSLGDEPGEMGDALPFVDLGAGRTAVAVATGVWSTCALLDDASAKCWGWNSNGWLGQGDKNHRGDQPGEMGDSLAPIDLGDGAKIETIALDNSHACALLSSGEVKCWGQQAEGNLGNGKPGGGAVGDGPGEMGDNLPALDFGAGHTAKALSLGARHGCVILDDDQVKCWGSNTFGQLGLGDTAHRGDDPGEMGDDLPYVDLGADRYAVAIAVSYFHSCAILDDDSLKCWGRNFGGALGQGDTDNRGDQPGELGDALPAIDLGTDRHAIKVAPGANYICALLDDHGVKCWGTGGSQSALGYEDEEARGDAPGEMGDALPYVDLGSE
jgi:alpha-tubulin suppressor-like RCC1 family protein